jgi:hypothetical protein
MDTSHAPVSKNNTLALTAGIMGLGSIVLSLLGLLLNLLLPGVGILLCCGVAILVNLAALVLGIVGLVQIKNHPGQAGKGWAIVGIVFGGLSILSICLFPIFSVAILTLMGPIIGNVFTKINSTLVAH